MSDDKVVGIDGKPVEETVSEPNEQIVFALETLLEKAKSGEMGGLIFLADPSDGSGVVDRGYLGSLTTHLSWHMDALNTEVKDFLSDYFVHGVEEDLE